MKVGGAAKIYKYIVEIKCYSCHFCALFEVPLGGNWPKKTFPTFFPTGSADTPAAPAFVYAIIYERNNIIDVFHHAEYT